jgi:ribosomal protein S18 acetylase RimI-like enzyme
MNQVVVSIKPAATADVLPLQQLSIATFIDTYGQYNTPENMQLYIDTYYNTERLLFELNDATMQFFIAWAGGAPAGYIKLRTNDNPPELAGKKHIEIERIYVLPAFKGMKIGKNLIEHAVQTALQQQYEVIWLGVWEENKNAQAFYTKQGFTIFGEHLFVLGTEPQRDWLMKMELAI